MSAPLTVPALTRRFVLLTALRWAPVGITVPVTVLLALSKGLTLAQVGLVFIAHSALVVVLELPTGGLADSLGRRPVLVASGLLHLGSLVAMATADGFPGSSSAPSCWAQGGRWTPARSRPGTSTPCGSPTRAPTSSPGLSRAGTADCAALALGAVAGGLAPSLLGGAAADVLLLPFAAAAVLDVLSVAAVVLLITPTGPARQGSVGASLRDGLRSVPGTVHEAVRLSARDAALRRVLLLGLVCGFTLSTLELFGPPLFADLAGSTTGGSGLFGVVMGASFLAGAAGSMLAPAPAGSPAARPGPRSRRSRSAAGSRSRSSPRRPAWSWPLRRTPPSTWATPRPGRCCTASCTAGSGEGRATVLSAESLCLQLGGALSGLLLPHLATATGGPGRSVRPDGRRGGGLGGARARAARGRRGGVRRRGSPARRVGG